MDTKEFHRFVAKGRSDLGVFSELTVAAECARIGMSVSRPLNGVQKGYDLIVDTDDGLVRVQVKTITTSGQVGLGHFDRAYSGETGEWYAKEVGKYDPGAFDFLAAVDRVTRAIYVVPVSDLDLSKARFTLRSDREKYRMGGNSFHLGST